MSYMSFRINNQIKLSFKVKFQYIFIYYSKIMDGINLEDSIAVDKSNVME